MTVQSTFWIEDELTESFGPLWAAERNDDEFSRPSFVPELGRRIWEETVPVSGREAVEARIYGAPDGGTVGYLRIPHYSFGAETLRPLGRIISRMEDETDALLLDQVDNFGGSLLKMYALLPYLSPTTLRTLPKHALRVDEQDIERARRILRFAGESSGGHGRGPSPYAVRFSQDMLAQVEAGRGFKGGTEPYTEPLDFAGVEEIEPGTPAYSKHLVVLCNELTFSAAEFLAATLQDAGRATIFGRRTAGAGGCAKKIVPPGAEAFGIDHITLRWTLGVRASGEYLEKNGVSPDVEYVPTVQDLQSGFGSYRDRLLAVLFQ